MMGDICTSTRAAVTHSSTFIRSRSFIIHKASYWLYIIKRLFGNTFSWITWYGIRQQRKFWNHVLYLSWRQFGFLKAVSWTDFDFLTSRYWQILFHCATNRLIYIANDSYWHDKESATVFESVQISWDTTNGHKREHDLKDFELLCKMKLAENSARK